MAWYWSSSESLHLIHKEEAEGSARPLNSSQERLGTKHSNIWVYKGHSHSNNHMPIGMYVHQIHTWCLWRLKGVRGGGHWITWNWSYMWLWTTRWVPGTGSRSSAWLTVALNHWALSPVPTLWHSYNVFWSFSHTHYFLSSLSQSHPTSFQQVLLLFSLF